MKTSIATVCLAGDLREKLEAIAAAGFDGIEIFEQDFIAFDGTPAEVGRMVRDHGLEVSLFQPFRDFEGLPEPHRARVQPEVDIAGLAPRHAGLNVFQNLFVLVEGHDRAFEHTLRHG